ncbi:serine hydrolase domain-containing protein [Streptomyces hesseae]|uniref:Serine hydrolase domain-containing protein n=1 Tax=Streptomyces hesseae TaxID=3075519 RepID=A0ABU2SGH4_9ACTN|nr:serine hydrolase domain-containing protein [Streptomyces sp. DSM 40473]MDT0448076.1 serine hydrolase domain-containing protein [Streptomyces sp. DSM 40473]
MRRRTAAVSFLLAAATLAPAAAPAVAAAPADGGSGAAARGADRGELQRALDAVVAQGVPGVVAEVRDGRGVWRGGSGVADLADGRKARPGDRFRAGSVTKSFVATVVLQLVAEGRVGLDDPVGRHLPGLVPDKDGVPVTVRQLLNHTSGLPNYTDTFQEEGAAYIRTVQHSDYTPRGLVEEALKRKRTDKPGDKWAYSNTNYVVLGMLIEKATGRTLAQEIDRRIVRPLHLTGTSVPSTAHLPGPHLNGYERLPGESTTTDFTDFSPTAFWGPGNLVSTTADLNRFFRALSGGELLPRHLWREMNTLHATDRGPERMYGLGLESNSGFCPGEKPVWGHTGSVPGYNTFSFTTADGKRQITLALGMNLFKSKEADVATVKVLSTALCAAHGK